MRRALCSQRPDPLQRQQVLELVLPLQLAVPEGREVSVETLAATGLAAGVEPLAHLIKKELQKGGFTQPNDRSLVGRFEQRLRSLKKQQR